ncbi:MAG TPA: hypothetical protein VJ508_10845, partial [Saprospiraceae bacterium]|nr:hypothetical protein [Saprospiraceae bacterium]
VQGSAPKRNYRIATALAADASSADIFTADVHASAPYLASNTFLHIIPAADYRKLLRSGTRDGALPEKKKSNSLVQALVKLINTYPFSILLGEGGWLYYKALVRNGKNIIEEKKITHLYSSFRPFVDHFAAYQLKKKFPHLFWIADFRDLIIDPHYRHIYNTARHQRLFKKIFSRADLLTTVSDGLALHLKAYNPRVMTLRNGISGAIIPTEPNPASEFSIVYTGSMFLDKRNARPLFQAVRELSKDGKIDIDHIRVHYAGKDGQDWQRLAQEYRIDTILVDHGLISPEAVKELQEKACINVLLTVSSTQLQGVLTGKLIEYIESGSPILGILVGQKDPELSSILSELEIGQSFSDEPEDLEGIKQFLLAEYLNWQRTGMNRKPVKMEVLRGKYAMEVIIRPLLNAIGP